MADEDISLTEDQLLENLDDGNNGDAEFLNEVRMLPNIQTKLFLFGLEILWQNAVV